MKKVLKLHDNYIWANKCKVMIIRPTVFHEFGEIEECLLTQLKFIA